LQLNKRFKPICIAVCIFCMENEFAISAKTRRLTILSFQELLTLLIFLSNFTGYRLFGLLPLSTDEGVRKIFHEIIRECR
jgi:hypothetical protein